MLEMDTYQTPQSDSALLAFHVRLAESLCAVLPPPLDATPEGVTNSHNAVLALVRRLGPVDDAEAELAFRYTVARVNGVHCEYQAREHPRGSKPAMKLIAQGARLAREGMGIWSMLATVQDERRRREKTNVVALPTSLPHGGEPVADSGVAAEAPAGAAAAPPAQSPASPAEAKPDRPRRSPPALRIIQGGLAS